MKYFTRFTDEIFAALVAIIFIVEAIADIVHTFQEPLVGQQVVNHDTAFLTLALALGTFMVARNLRTLRNSRYLRRKLREFLADFGPSVERAWLVDLFSVPTWVILASIIPGVMATILLYLDQNITTRLVNASGNRLCKGAGFQLDLLIVGLITFVAPAAAGEPHPERRVVRPVPVHGLHDAR